MAQIAVTVIHAALLRDTLILSPMEAMAQELALRYMLELSTDIRAAFLVDEHGRLSAAAPERPGERAERAGLELAGAARKLAEAGGTGDVELDITVDGGGAFVVCGGGPAMVCVTGQFALAGLIFHDMRIALADLRRGGTEAA